MSLLSIIQQAEAHFQDCATRAALDQAKAQYLGKNGPIVAQMRKLSALSPDEKRQQGREIQAAKSSIEATWAKRRDAIQAALLAQRLAQEAVDVTLPGYRHFGGGLHPLTQCRQQIADIFRLLGFVLASGPEIETDWYNFCALNTPKKHPARSMHDTFYVQTSAHSEDLLLRTHTSPIQIRYLEQHLAKHQHSATLPPVRIIAPGKVYRVDSDATHSPMFHQVEGLCIDQSVSFANLKWLMIGFLRHFFQDEHLKVRFRPSFFPFTEPSAEVDIACIFCTDASRADCSVCSATGWLEVGGCGMVHPRVLQNCHFDPECWQGLAFGVGIERLAMLKYRIGDLRTFYNNDLRFLSQFNSHAFSPF